MRPSDRNRNSFADIAKLLSDFFRDLDVVPSDVVAGLVLLRKFQKIEREAIVKEVSFSSKNFIHKKIKLYVCHFYRKKMILMSSYLVLP